MPSHADLLILERVVGHMDTEVKKLTPLSNPELACPLGPHVVRSHLSGRRESTHAIRLAQLATCRFQIPIRIAHARRAQRVHWLECIIRDTACLGKVRSSSRQLLLLLRSIYLMDLSQNLSVPVGDAPSATLRTDGVRNPFTLADSPVRI